MIDIKPYGEKAILVQFEQVIDLNIHQKVMALTNYAESIEGVNYCIPAYCSITIAYTPENINFTELKSHLEQFDLSSKTDDVKRKSFKIPVCYNGDFAPDLENLASEKGMHPEEIIKLHTQTKYHVYMMGFIPGFPYLGKLPVDLACKRHQNPRAKVPAGAVGLAGLQTGIYPSEAPGGWQIIGRTPVDILQANKTNPFMLNMGDTIEFYAIDELEFKTFREKIKSSELTEKNFYG